MIQAVYAQINGNNLIIKLSQYASHKDLEKSIVIAIINYGRLKR